MNKFKILSIFIILAIIFSIAGLTFNVNARPLFLHSPTLGAAASFTILAATTITDANPVNTHITGDLGSTGLGTAILIPCTSMLGGAIYSVDGSPVDTCVVNNSAVPTNAQAANVAAFGDLIAGDNSACTNIPVELGGQSLVPGVYCSGGNFTLNGTLTLVGTQGTWIFQAAETLTTVGAAAQVVGGDPCNVWWRLPSDATAADIGTGSSMIGNILAFGAITFGDGASLNGRAFSQIGEVTLIGNNITHAVCAVRPTRRPPSSTAVGGLPNTGGAPIQNNSFPWSLVILGGLGAVALTLGVIAYRRDHLTKK
jgi:hypothetical protein